jgi:hypothetical protein
VFHSAYDFSNASGITTKQNLGATGANCGYVRNWLMTNTHKRRITHSQLIILTEKQLVNYDRDDRMIANGL